jgi:hypothetical protein
VRKHDPRTGPSRPSGGTASATGLVGLVHSCPLLGRAAREHGTTGRVRCSGGLLALMRPCKTLDAADDPSRVPPRTRDELEAAIAGLRSTHLRPPFTTATTLGARGP